MQSIKILSSTDIKVMVSMKEAIDVMGMAFKELYQGNFQMPLRTITDFGEDELSLFYKPSFMPKEEIVGVKLLGQSKKKSTNGNPTIQGIVVLINSKTNSIVGILDGTYLTALRTGAASGIATRYLARKESSVMAIFGAGAQGHSQFEAICCERNITKAYIYDIDSTAADRFANYYKSWSSSVLIPTNELSCLNEVDIICTATNSCKPLFSLKMLKKGVHINAIGSYNPTMQELPDDLFTSASLYVDQKDSCFAESGDIIIPISKGTFKPENYKGEIGELIASKVTGRTSSSEITIFKSVGLAIQDLAIANYAYTKACEENIGQVINI
jgi:ornithine cyclodeaminase/alanine dehydrogenase-like protein (mu-crystallin family)